MGDDPPVPRARTATARETIREQLRAGSATAHELSALASVREKEVASHLEHIEKSARARGEKFVVEPAACLACAYVFRDRKKLTTPGACPKCRSERVAPPRFRLEAR